MLQARLVPGSLLFLKKDIPREQPSDEEFVLAQYYFNIASSAIVLLDRFEDRPKRNQVSWKCLVSSPKGIIVMWLSEANIIEDFLTFP